MTRSYFDEGLRHRPYKRLHSKLGIGSDLVTKQELDYDGAIIEREVADPSHPHVKKTICYAAAGFDDSTGGHMLHYLIRALDDCILENNGLISP